MCVCVREGMVRGRLCVKGQDVFLSVCERGREREKESGRLFVCVSE